MLKFGSTTTTQSAVKPFMGQRMASTSCAPLELSVAKKITGQALEGSRTKKKVLVSVIPR